MHERADAKLTCDMFAGHAMRADIDAISLICFAGTLFRWAVELTGSCDAPRRRQRTRRRGRDADRGELRAHGSERAALLRGGHATVSRAARDDGRRGAQRRVAPPRGTGWGRSPRARLLDNAPGAAPSAARRHTQRAARTWPARQRASAPARQRASAPRGHARRLTARSRDASARTA
ncbi:hypothetical protein FGB62_53g013 [Gracilaria domingensis]|nr:hypothetical protein FGB62_53g013 [Gracilaria domingensis]